MVSLLPFSTQMSTTRVALRIAKVASGNNRSHRRIASQNRNRQIVYICCRTRKHDSHLSATTDVDGTAIWRHACRSTVVRVRMRGISLCGAHSIRQYCDVARCMGRRWRPGDPRPRHLHLVRNRSCCDCIRLVANAKVGPPRRFPITDLWIDTSHSGYFIRRRRQSCPRDRSRRRADHLARRCTLVFVAGTDQRCVRSAIKSNLTVSGRECLMLAFQLSLMAQRCGTPRLDWKSDLALFSRRCCDLSQLS
jgi:hypothetical protein